MMNVTRPRFSPFVQKARMICMTYVYKALEFGTLIFIGYFIELIHLFYFFKFQFETVCLLCITLKLSIGNMLQDRVLF
jgi:hypothetical protein